MEKWRELCLLLGATPKLKIKFSTRIHSQPARIVISCECALPDSIFKKSCESNLLVAGLRRNSRDEYEIIIIMYQK